MHPSIKHIMVGGVLLDVAYAECRGAQGVKFPTETIIFLKVNVNQRLIGVKSFFS
jgi:hypothetical protein